MSYADMDLLGVWDVSFLHYRWVYTFKEGGRVTWRDEATGKTGTGKWTNTGAAITVSWDKSTARETWRLPITDKVTGETKSDKLSGWFQAEKRYSRSFAAFSPEGQQHANACWAACIAWTTKVLPNMQTISQTTLMDSVGSGSVFGNGSMKPEKMISLQRPGFGFAGMIPPDQLYTYVRGDKMPIIIAFQRELGGHVNVIFDYDELSGSVGVMEPWYPNPAYAPGYSLNEDTGDYFNTSGKMFKFNGQMTRRPYSYYSSRSLADGRFWIMVPA